MTKKEEADRLKYRKAYLGGKSVIVPLDSYEGDDTALKVEIFAKPKAERMWAVIEIDADSKFLSIDYGYRSEREARDTAADCRAGDAADKRDGRVR
jgi:hypothetical protein